MKNVCIVVRNKRKEFCGDEFEAGAKVLADGGFAVVGITGEYQTDTAFAAHAATVLRDYGVRTQLYTEDRKFKQKLSYASKLAIPYAVIIGEDELANGEVSLKDMNAGTQLRCTPEDAALAVRDGLKALASEKLIKVN